jgi:hypothetical protein
VRSPKGKNKPDSGNPLEAFVPNLTPLTLADIPEGAVYVTKRQAAELIGMSPSWVSKQMSLGNLRAYKISSRRNLYLKAEVLALVSASPNVG